MCHHPLEDFLWGLFGEALCLCVCVGYKCLKKNEHCWQSLYLLQHTLGSKLTKTVLEGCDVCLCEDADGQGLEINSTKSMFGIVSCVVVYAPFSTKGSNGSTTASSTYPPGAKEL